MISLHGNFQQSAPTSQRKHIRFILSRGAGKGLANELISEIVRCYPHATHTSVGASRKEAGIVTISLTRGPDDVATLAREWDKWWGSHGVVYIAGGDGSVNEVGNALAGKECAFGVLPMGTGNDFARMIYGGKTSKKFALTLVEQTLTAQFQPIDALKVNDLYCVNVFSLGYDTEVLQKAIEAKNRHPKLGSLSYVAGVAQTALQEKNIPLHITYSLGEQQKSLPGPLKTIEALARGEREMSVTVAQECIVMLVGNGQYYGSGYYPLPHARIDDAQANLLYVDSLNLAQFGKLLGSYRKGSHLKNHRVHTAAISELAVQRTDGKKLLWNIDGIVHESTEVRVNIVPQALTLAILKASDTSILSNDHR